jgi:hypothetical protein
MLSQIRNFVFAGLTLTMSASIAAAQGGLGAPVLPQPTAPIITESSVAPYAPQTSTLSGLGLFDFGRGSSGFLTGNHDFDRFIGFMSNPIQSIDPRAVTEIWPMFSSASANGNGPILAEANAQAYGAGIYIALSDRLSFGLNQGGYGVLNINGTRQGILAKLGLPVPERDVGGQREGWLNLGGFVQYTLIADVPNQFLLTAGLRWEAPAGATQMFQGGASPAYLSPYLTAGKEFGCWHVLATTGYEFPAGEGQGTTSTYYLNLHIDRQFGWLYPLVEFNGSYHTSTVDLSLPTRHGVLDLGSFESSGNLLTIAVGANAVLVPGKLEFGAVYTRPIAAQDHFEFNGVLVKMVYRY